MVLATLILQAALSTPAVAIHVTGEVQLDTGSEQRVLSRFEQVDEGSTITTGPDGSAQLRFSSGSLVRLGAGTTLKVTELKHQTPAGKRKESLKLVAGKLWARVTGLFGGGDSKFEVETNNAVAGVRGTAFLVETGDNDDRFTVLHGSVELMRDEQRLLLDGAGAFATAGGGKIGTAGRLDAQQLMAARRRVGGARGAILSRLEARAETQSTGSQNSTRAKRNKSRRDMVGPTNTVDTPVTRDSQFGSSLLGGPGGLGGGANVDVILKIPEPGSTDSGR